MPSVSVAQIEEVIVTASKRESGLQDAPMSVSAVSGDEMKYRQVGSITDMATQVPGLSVSESGGSTLVSIRGVGMNVDSGAVEPGVAVHVNGVYQPRPSTGPLGLNDLARVEVLRGPQGTLYGRNSTGGVVNFILNRPSSESEGSVRAGLSNYGTQSMSGVVSGPLIKDVLLGRTMLEWNQSDGYVKELERGGTSDDVEGYGGRVALTWLATDLLSFELGAIYRDDEGGGLTPRDVIRVAPDPQKETTGLFFNPAQTTSEDQYVDGEPWERRLNYNPVGDRSTVNVDITIAYEMDFGTLKLVSGYQTHEYKYVYDADFTSDDIYNFAPDGFGATSDSLSHELTLSGATERLDWLIGGYFFEEDYTPLLQVSIPKAFGGAGLEALLTADETAESVALFTDMAYSLTDTIRVLVGFRALEDKKEADQTNKYALGGVPLELIPLSLIPADSALPKSCEQAPLSIESGRKYTPKYGVQWDVGDDYMVYGQYTLGYKSGGSNFSSCGDTYEPEEVESYELGMKSSWFDRRLIANLSIFDSSYSNFQVLKIEGIAASIINAPEAKIQGAELELQAQLLEPLMLTVSGSYLDAYYKEFFDTDSSNPENGEQDLSGVQLSRAPKYTVNTGLEYSWEMDVELLSYWRFRVEYFLSDDLVYRPYGGPEDGQESYALVNSYLSIMNADEKLAINIFSKNITNTEYYLYSAGDSTGRIYGPAGQPNSYGVEVSYRF
ncbi:TonB-dependent receptor [Spongiibacter sp. KMU-166]|uniref:TonB-dependent receptor n=1 Tax=Spongiibacter thalassae TaxID=2721624 RepID=A0ABX1G9P2_9GAMM|nr:TonB-dependent receptor [Spongiibacter thalassae]NKI15868.1 TonB-dependent receptor [Spongiibacter thalassae]